MAMGCCPELDFQDEGWPWVAAHNWTSRMKKICEQLEIEREKRIKAMRGQGEKDQMKIELDGIGVCGKWVYGMQCMEMHCLWGKRLGRKISHECTLAGMRRRSRMIRND